MSTARYAFIQKLLHWLIALSVIGALAAGKLIDFVGNGDFKNMLYANHKATGFLILGLMILRLVVRMIYGAPGHGPAIARWQQTAASATHTLFYILLILMPVIGWAATSAFPAPLPFFGLFEVPPLIGKDRELSKQLFEIHEIMGNVIIALALTHIGAALYHGFILKDGVLRRMWF